MCTSYYRPNWLSTLYYYTTFAGCWATNIFSHQACKTNYFCQISRHTFFFKFHETILRWVKQYSLSRRQTIFFFTTWPILAAILNCYFVPNPTKSKLFFFSFLQPTNYFFPKNNLTPPKKANGKSLNRSRLNSLEQACNSCMYYMYIITLTFMIKIHPVPGLWCFISNTQWRFQVMSLSQLDVKTENGNS